MEQSGFALELLPNHIIIKIITDLLNTQDETIQSNIANIGSIRIVNSLIESDHNKVRIVDFMDTCLWLRLLISIGIFDNQPHIKWCDKIKEYLSRIVRERRYTSRVHDLIDISKYESSQHIRDYARCLLYHLITEDSDEIERQFLLGEMSDIPSLNNTTIVEFVKNKEQFKNIKYWDVRNVTVMSHLFHFNKNVNTMLNDLVLTYWDTRNVTTMNYLMSNISITIHGITNWNTCRVKDMSYCFANTESFNVPLEWNTSSVKKMSGMFYKAESFNQPLDWDTSNVISMFSMFENAKSFNQPLEWNTRNVVRMLAMFENAKSFNQPLVWNTSNVTTMKCMFQYADSFNNLLLFDTSKVIDMTYMFYGTRSFNQPLHWNTKNVTDMSYMFEDATSFNQALDWNIINVTHMSDMFENSQGRFIHS
jgi:hypothetical protein